MKELSSRVKFIMLGGLEFARNFCHVIYWNAISFTYCLQNRFPSRDFLVPRLKPVHTTNSVGDSSPPGKCDRLNDMQKT